MLIIHCCSGDVLVWAIPALQIDIDHDLVGAPAIGQGEAGALHGSHLGTDEVVAVIVERRLAHGVA